MTQAAKTATRCECFRRCYKPVLSAKQNDGQYEEINVIDQPPAENSSLPVQETEISLVGHLFCCT